MLQKMELSSKSSPFIKVFSTIWELYFQSDKIGAWDSFKKH